MEDKPKRKALNLPRITEPVDTSEADRVFISGRIPPVLYRQVKGFAGNKGRKVQDVLEVALTEYLANQNYNS